MRVMAIDYGASHTGVAISDNFGMLAGWTTVIVSWRPAVVVEKLLEIIKEHGVDEIVMGFPKYLNDTQGERVQLSRELAAALEESSGMEVHLWDERLTTVDAHRILTENGRHGKKRKQLVDAVAATLILEGYLGCKRSKA